jgi:hypothetical protein
VQPGHWLIEGWDVRYRQGSRARFWNTGEWSAELFGRSFTRRTLAEVRRAIADYRGTDTYPQAAPPTV